MNHSQREFHHIEQEIYVEDSVETTFEALLDINGWWSRRFVNKPDSLRLETRVGGRFWESRDGSETNGFLWGTVTSIEPNDHIVLMGSIGMQGAIVGNVTLCTIPQDNGRTQVTLSHHILGHVPDRLLEGFKTGWQTNLNMLKNLVENGERVAPPTT